MVRRRLLLDLLACLHDADLLFVKKGDVKLDEELSVLVELLKVFVDTDLRKVVCPHQFIHRAFILHFGQGHVPCSFRIAENTTVLFECAKAQLHEQRLLEYRCKA